MLICQFFLYCILGAVLGQPCTASMAPVTGTQLSTVLLRDSIVEYDTKNDKDKDTTESGNVSSQMNTIGTFSSQDFNVPGFQSFEEWKRMKLSNSDAEADADPCGSIVADSNGTLQGDVWDSQKSSREPSLRLQISSSKIPNPEKYENMISQKQPQIDVRDSTGLDKKESNSNLNSALGEDSVFEMSMFGFDDDQGKLYKDRFNYASFDCAATIVKTNKEAKSANSILVDNKDSYLLNECSSSSKFIIIELCEDILVDEVLIGNYEFYSSMFKDVRISVSNRFPATQWMKLGDFKAENIRKLQTFRIENPLIWAKFLKIEFLTHYGNEFYCPISSVQVHGTTMIEQFKDQNEIQSETENRGDNNLKSAVINEEVGRTETESDSLINDLSKTETSNSLDPKFLGVKDDLTPVFNVSRPDLKCFNFDSINTEISCSSKYLKLDQFLNEIKNNGSAQCSVNEVDETIFPKKQTTHSTTVSTNNRIQPQDSIYQNIIKRLSLLESNATLSLLYIEEQSKLLSDAFINLENKHSIKFQNILVQLNSTIQSQMDIFQKLNTDVYLSFSNLFEYQQQSFDIRNDEILAQISKVSSSIKFYKNLTFLCIFLLIVLFGYILLTRDIYIDETSLMPLQSGLVSPNSQFSPTISPASSISNFKGKTETEEHSFVSMNNRSDEIEDLPELNLENLPESPSHGHEPLSQQQYQRPQLVLRRRSTFLDPFSFKQSWSPKSAASNKALHSNSNLINISTPSSPILEYVASAPSTPVSSSKSFKQRPLRERLQSEKLMTPDQTPEHFNSDDESDDITFEYEFEDDLSPVKSNFQK